MSRLLTMKSSIGITHPANLRMIAEIYTPSVIFLLQIVGLWVCLHSLTHNELWGYALWSFKVIQGSLKLVPTTEAYRYENYYYSPLLWHLATA